MLCGPFQSNALTPVNFHLGHPCKDVLHPYSHAADGVVGLLLGLTQWMSETGGRSTKNDKLIPLGASLPIAPSVRTV